MPKQITVSAKAPKEDGSSVEGVATVNWGESLEETVSLYGDAAVDSNALASATVTIQGGIRRMLRAGKSSEEIQAAFDGWKLGVAIARVSDPTAAIMAKWPGMSEEARTAFLNDLKATTKK